MSNQQQNPLQQRSATTLIPEELLLSKLSERWQKRFTQALLLIEKIAEEKDPNINWDDIAQQCAISPYHFHRMFRLVFHEPPGQYLQRKRLQWAALLLVDRPHWSISHIAHEVGFASSQS